LDLWSQSKNRKSIVDEIKREILAPGIISYYDVGKNISKMIPEWEQHIDNGSLHWSPSYVGKNVMSPKIREVKIIGIANDGRKMINENIKEHLDSVYQLYIDDYCKKYNTDTVGSDGYQILKYEKGHHYKAHIDWGRGDAVNKRTFSFTHYLNDDYEGGEINYVEFGLKIKPKKHQLIIFPAHFPYAHKVEPVISGERWAIVKFLH